MNNSDKKIADFAVAIRRFYILDTKKTDTYFTVENSENPGFKSRHGLYFLVSKIPISDLILIVIFSFNMSF